MNADGTDETQVTDSAGVDERPDWSAYDVALARPDGRDQEGPRHPLAGPGPARHHARSRGSSPWSTGVDEASLPGAGDGDVVA